MTGLVQLAGLFLGEKLQNGAEATFTWTKRFSPPLRQDIEWRSSWHSLKQLKTAQNKLSAIFSRHGMKCLGMHLCIYLNSQSHLNIGIYAELLTGQCGQWQCGQCGVSSVTESVVVGYLYDDMTQFTSRNCKQLFTRYSPSTYLYISWAFPPLDSSSST